MGGRVVEAVVSETGSGKPDCATGAWVGAAAVERGSADGDPACRSASEGAGAPDASVS